MTKKIRLPRKLKKLNRKKLGAIQFAFGRLYNQAFSVVSRLSQFAKACGEMAKHEITFNNGSKIGIVPFNEPMYHIRSFDLKGYNEEDYPRFNHVSDALDRYMLELLKGKGYEIRQPLVAINTIHLNQV